MAKYSHPVIKPKAVGWLVVGSAGAIADGVHRHHATNDRLLGGVLENLHPGREVLNRLGEGSVVLEHEIHRCSFLAGHHYRWLGATARRSGRAHLLAVVHVEQSGVLLCVGLSLSGSLRLSLVLCFAFLPRRQVGYEVRPDRLELSVREGVVLNVAGASVLPGGARRRDGFVPLQYLGYLGLNSRLGRGRRRWIDGTPSSVEALNNVIPLRRLLGVVWGDLVDAVFHALVHHPDGRVLRAELLRPWDVRSLEPAHGLAFGGLLLLLRLDGRGRRSHRGCLVRPPRQPRRRRRRRRHRWCWCRHVRHSCKGFARARSQRFCCDPARP
mmetsp:Transcript_10188/g.26079  ORF Transcript_10188/g.26079 Transcript_10188/m.26079 type:complete len:326 (-) Transcript_10188:19-996(-)